MSAGPSYATPSCVWIDGKHAWLSTALRIIDACRTRATDPSEPRRITYGPDLLTSLFADKPEDVTILPLHYFYVIPDRETAHRFWKTGRKYSRRDNEAIRDSVHRQPSPLRRPPVGRRWLQPAKNHGQGRFCGVGYTLEIPEILFVASK